MRKVKMQYTEASGSRQYFDIDPEKLLENAKTWFLRTILNTELTADGMLLSASDYISDECLSRERTPPYNLQYPGIAWIISTLDRDQIESIFGVIFYDKIVSIARTYNLTDLRTTFVPKRGEA